MKKIVCIMLVLMVPAMALADISDDDFSFAFDGVTYSLGENSTEIVAAIEDKYGCPMEVTESVSCLFDGMDKEFANDDIVIGTYPIDGKDVTETIMVFSDEYASFQGGRVGMSRDEISAIYGNDFLFDYDQMIYTSQEGGSLIFTFDMELDECVCWTAILGTVA